MLITLLIVTNYWMKVLFTMNCKEIKIITVQISLSITIRAQWMVKYRDCESHFPIASSNLRPLCLYSLNQILENRIFTKLLISACLTHILLMIDHDSFQNQVVFCRFEKYVYIWTTFLSIWQFDTSMLYSKPDTYSARVWYYVAYTPPRCWTWHVGAPRTGHNARPPYRSVRSHSAPRRHSAARTRTSTGPWSCSGDCPPKYCSGPSPSSP